MKFWDSSAIAPLLVEEEDSERREAMLREDPDMLVWYATLAEIESALCRRLRENPRWRPEAARAREKLRHLAEGWTEIEPTRAIRARAIRLLGVHSLRTADAFQLASALTAYSEQTVGRHFLTADTRLVTAASAEGFIVE